ncbi:MAG: hypothetical protein N2316_10220 [Spirochaetes bacterium]|nr:hypothetical protein [Spirochaetota bacterium]
MRAIIAIAFFLITCTPKGALTPEEAYYGLKAAYQQGNDEAVIQYLSTSTLQKMEELIAKITSSDVTVLQAWAESMMSTPEELRRLTPKTFIALQRRMDKKAEVQLASFFLTKPIAIAIKENRAEIINEAGIKMKLVKEGPYWKFEESIF